MVSTMAETVLQPAELVALLRKSVGLAREAGCLGISEMELQAADLIDSLIKERDEARATINPVRVAEPIIVEGEGQADDVGRTGSDDSPDRAPMTELQAALTQLQSERDKLIKERDEQYDGICCRDEAIRLVKAHKTELAAALTKALAERDALLEVVKPFADLAEQYRDDVPDSLGFGSVNAHPFEDFSLADLRKARDVRNEIDAGKGK